MEICGVESQRYHDLWDLDFSNIRNSRVGLKQPGGSGAKAEDGTAAADDADADADADAADAADPEAADQAASPKRHRAG